MKSKTTPRDADEPPNDCGIDDQEPPTETDDSSDLDETDVDDADDDRWDVFIVDDDDCDPLPELGDFWMPD